MGCTDSKQDSKPAPPLYLCLQLVCGYQQRQATPAFREEPQQDLLWQVQQGRVLMTLVPTVVCSAFPGTQQLEQHPPCECCPSLQRKASQLPILAAV